MKKNLIKKLSFSWIFTTMLLVTFSGMSQNQSLVFADAQTESHSVSLVSNNPNTVVLRFNLNQMDLKVVQTEKFGSMSIAISGDAPQIMQRGNPDLFYLNGSVIIPDFGSTELKVEPGEYVEYNNIDIAPSKGNLTRDVNPRDIPYEKGELYEKDAFFPGELASLREPYILRDYRGQVVDIYPLQYNPVTKTLRVYKDITVSVVSNQISGTNELIDRRANQNVLAEFERIYSRNFLNYAPSAKYTAIEEDGLMLVVAHADYMEAIKPLVNWKNQKGQPTRLVSYTEAGGSAANLKTYFTNQYNSEEGLAFVLLVGDGQHIPPLNKSGHSDAAFGHIVGTDSYAEVFIGRFSSETVKHVEDQVAKTIAYERDLTVADTWLKTGMGIASNEGSNPSDIQHMDAIRTQLLAYTYSNVHQVYDPGATAATVVSNLNNGLGIINYVGHGSDTYWVTSNFGVSNMGSLTNVNKLPFIFDVACVNGNFVGKTCFAEAFMRASNTGGPTGTVAIIASTINQSWVPPMTGQNEMNAILTESYASNIKRTYGGIAINGCMKMNDVHSSGGYEMTNTWTIFGDPSLVVRTDTPSAMVISHNPTLFLGSSSFGVTSDTDGALVAISYINGEGQTQLLGTAIVEGGSATVTFAEPIVTPLDLTVTVTAYNKVTYTGAVSAVPADEPYIVLKSFQTATSPDYGQTVSLDVVLENISEDPYTASAVSATLTTTSPFVTIIDGVEPIGTVNPDQVVTFDGAFSFSIANDVTDQTPLTFTISISGEYGSDVYTWQQNFSIKANAPFLKYGTLSLDDTGSGDSDGILDPGETADLTLTLSNTGHAAVSDLTGLLTTANPNLTIVNGTFPVASLAAGASTSLVYTVTADASTPLGTSVNLTASATAGEYSATGAYEVIIGFVPVYCASGATSTSYSDLTGFTFGPLENTTPVGGTYDDFTQVPELVHEYMLGATYDVSVTLGSTGSSYTKGAKVFVDWNYDGDFTDAGETAFTVTPQNANWTATGTITIPADAPLGQKYLRVVVMETSSLSNINPCGTYSWGGTEDYRIILVAPEAPLTDFTATPLVTVENDVVVFTDLTTNAPTAWSWTITPGVEGTDWTFVESTSATSRHPRVQFISPNTYTVALEASNMVGSVTETKTDYITINELTEVPVAGFSVSSAEVYPGVAVQLTDASTNLPISWAWTITPGVQGTDWSYASGTDAGSKNPVVTFSTPGYYSITLVATNPVGASAPYTQEDAVHVLEVYLMQTGTITTCSGAFFDTGGPNGAYSNNANLTLTILPTVQGDKVKVTFSMVNLESYDQLQVFDGQNATATLLATISGTNVPNPIVATNASGALTFKFTSNGSVTRDGWAGTFGCVTPIPSYSVSFAVVDANAAPIAGAWVALTGHGSRRTNTQGIAIFPEIDAVQGLAYTVTNSGYQAASGTVDVVDSDVTVEVMLNITGAPVNLSDGVRVYPNPFGPQLTLEGVAHVRQVEVISLIGQRVLLMESHGGETLTLPTDHLQPGVYMIRLTGEHGMQSLIKVVKQ